MKEVEKKIENLAKRKLRTHQNGNTSIKVRKWKSFAPYTSFTAKISDFFQGKRIQELYSMQRSAIKSFPVKFYTN